MTNLYPKLFDYNNDDLYYDKIIEVLLILKKKRLELNINKKSKDTILIKDIELEKAIVDIINNLNGDYLKTLNKSLLYAEKFKRWGWTNNI